MDLVVAEWIYRTRFIWLALLVAFFIAMYLVKRRTGLQGWRRMVPGNISAGIAWIARGVSMAIGFLCKKVLKKVPWKPILIWGPWVVIILVVGFHLVENWRGAGAWDKERAAWLARGETLDMAAFMPEPVPDADNFVQHPAVQAELSASPPLAGPLRGELPGFTDRKNEDIWNGNPQLGIPVDVTRWLPLPGRPSDEQTAARQCLTLFGPIEKQMAEVAEAARRPACHFKQKPGHWAFTDGWEHPLLFKFRDFGDAYRSRALLHLRLGEAERAAQDLETVLLLAQHMESDRRLLGAFVEVNLLLSLACPLWEGLDAGVWNDAQLARFELRLREFDLPLRGHGAMRLEAVSMPDHYDYVASHREVPAAYGDTLEWLWADWTPGWWDDLLRELNGPATVAMPRGWFDLWLADSMQRIDRIIMRPGGVPAARLTASMVPAARRDREELEQSYMGSFRSLLQGRTDDYVTRILWTQARVDLMRVAIGLERFRMRTGDYPKRLGDLVPQEIPKLPVDLVSGKAMQHRLKEDGTPLLFTVGINRTDEGGVPCKRPERLDWVWQYTRTPGHTRGQWMLGQLPRTIRKR